MLDSKFTPDQILRIGDALAKLQAAEIGARQKVLALRARVRELESAHMNYDRAQGAHMHVLGAGQGQAFMKAILTAGKEICVLEREIRDCTRATQEMIQVLGRPTNTYNAAGLPPFAPLEQPFDLHPIAPPLTLPAINSHYAPVRNTSELHHSRYDPQPPSQSAPHHHATADANDTSNLPQTATAAAQTSAQPPNSAAVTAPTEDQRPNCATSGTALEPIILSDSDSDDHEDPQNADDAGPIQRAQRQDRAGAGTYWWLPAAPQMPVPRRRSAQSGTSTDQSGRNNAQEYTEIGGEIERARCF